MPVPEATCRDRECSDLIQRCLLTFGCKPICGLARTDLIDLDECPVEEAVRLARNIRPREPLQQVCPVCGHRPVANPGDLCTVCETRARLSRGQQPITQSQLGVF